jgi:bifunctional non-homologous end joining protein LigD
MLASPDQLPTGPGWIYELKYDGYRVLAGKDRGTPFLRYRRGSTGIAAWPEIAAALECLPYQDLVLDGELVVRAAGEASFHLIQKRFGLRKPAIIAEAMKSYPATLLVFDLLALEELDARPLKLTERKTTLADVLTGAAPALRYVEHTDDGAHLYGRSRALGGEGVVAKRADSHYQGGRGSAWVKVRLNPTMDFVVVGYSLPGERAPALHVGGYHEGELIYVGTVRGGLPRGFIEKADALLRPTTVPAPPCRGVEPDVAETWVEPRVVLEVGVAEVTPSGVLRHAEFVRLRPDKRPSECALGEGVGAGIEGRPIHSRRSRWG